MFVKWHYNIGGSSKANNESESGSVFIGQVSVTHIVRHNLFHNAASSTCISSLSNTVHFLRYAHLYLPVNFVHANGLFIFTVHSCKQYRQHRLHNSDIIFFPRFKTNTGSGSFPVWAPNV